MDKETANEIHGSWARYRSEYASERVLRAFNTHVANYPHKQAEDCLRGLIFLLEFTGNQCGPSTELNRMLGYHPEMTVEEVKSAFEKHSESALAEQAEDCPEEEDHPWGDEEFEAMQTWLGLHPFEWFVVNKIAKERGMDYIEDCFDELVLDDPCSSKGLHEAIHEEYGRMMHGFVQRIYDRRKADAKKAS